MELKILTPQELYDFRNKSEYLEYMKKFELQYNKFHKLLSTGNLEEALFFLSTSIGTLIAFENKAKEILVELQPEQESSSPETLIISNDEV